MPSIAGEGDIGHIEAKALDQLRRTV